MKQVDKIIYEAIKADESLMAKLAYTTPQGGTAYALRSTCFEVPPDELDNTPVPYVVIHDDGFQNQQTTKDCVWEALVDQVQATVEIAADSPEEVKQLIKDVRKAVENYIVTLYSSGEDIPELLSITSDGIDWDWMKPCYFSHLVYQCLTNTDTDDEQEETI
jgi:hypothetical protein